MPAVSHASAEEAARSWLLLTQTLIRARAHHDEAVAESAIAEMRRLIYLPGALLDRLAEVEKREAFERSMVDNWSAGIAYYTEGYQWDSLHAIAPPAADSPTVVEIAATGEEGGAVIAVHCVSTDQGWRVRSLGLLPEAKVAAPAGVRASGEAAPSSAPAPATQP